MKRTVLSLLCFLALAGGLQAQKIPNLKPFKTLPEATLTPAQKKDHWGYADPKGKMVIKAVFDAAEPFMPVTEDDVTMDVAKICVAGKWGFITKENAYLFMPEYDDLTDFDEGGNAVGTIDGMRSLLGVHPAMSAKGTFQTLAGSVLMWNLSEIGPFNTYGLAMASERSKWGLVNRTGSWVLPAGNDSIEEMDGMYYITRGGKKGVVALDGHILVDPVYDYLEWRGDKEQFVARTNGKYGILYRDGNIRYACIFDQVPVESSRGYVEMWQGDTPALYIPDKGVYPVEEYDEMLSQLSSYATSPALPDWMKRHLDKTGPVTITSDMGNRNLVDVSDYDGEDYSTLSQVILKCGKPLSEVLTEAFKDQNSLDPEDLAIYDEGNLLYVVHGYIDDGFGISAIDLTGEGKDWESYAIDPFIFRRDGIVADGWAWRDRMNLSGQFFPATCFDRAGGSHIPVMRYEYHTWAGRPVVFLGHNFPLENCDEEMKPGWRALVTGPTSFFLGDYKHGDIREYREETFVKVHPAGPDGIALYEIQQQDVDYTEDWDLPSRGPKKTVAWGYVGLTRPFFTQALFDSAHDIEGGMTDVEMDGEWERLSMNELQRLDPFLQPSGQTEVAVNEEEVDEEAIPFQLVEVKPTFNGGDANEFSNWVNSRLVYPEIAKENGVQGRVTLQFTVEADGRVTHVRVLRGVDEALDREAVRVVSSSPKWKPGQQKGKYVKVTYTFPVIFQLR